MKITKEPFFYFIIIGLLIFMIDAFINRSVSSADEIIITQDDVDRLSALYIQNWNQKPDASTIENLIEEYITSEIYYQEALKLNLDHNDEIIKRRLRQKYEFVAHDLADLAEPSEEELERYYKSHSGDYTDPVRLRFHQYYVNPDVHKDVLSTATELSVFLQNKLPAQLSDVGDNSHLPVLHEDADRMSVARIFGGGFSDALFENPVTGWQEAIRSGYGYHVVYVDKITPEALIAYDDVSARVNMDWKNANRVNLTDAIIKELRANYKIVRQDDGK